MDTKPEPGKRAGLLDDYMTEAELAADVKKHPRTVKRWRDLRVGPPYSMMGESPIYHIPTARQWIAAGGTAAASNNKRRRRRA